MSRLRVGDLEDSTHSRPEGHGHVRVQCHPGDGLADSLQLTGSLSIVSVGGLPPYAGRYLCSIPWGQA